MSAADMAMLTTAARHVEKSALLPNYARDAIGSACRLIAAQREAIERQQAQITMLAGMVQELRELRREPCEGCGPARLDVDLARERDATREG